MFTANQKRKLFRQVENKKFKIYRLKGGGEVKLQKPYSLRKKGKFIYVFRGHNGKAISYFCQGVSPVTIERFVAGYEVNLQRKEKERERKMTLKEYCEASFSHCKAANWDCNKCESNYKEWALERKKEGKKVVRPGRKKEEFMEAIQERNALLKQTSPKNEERFFKRNYSGKWR